MSKKSLEYQQQYRQVFGDIVAGFSSFKATVNGEIEVFYVKHLKEMDYGKLERLGESFLQEARSKGLLDEKAKLILLHNEDHWSSEEEDRYQTLLREIEDLKRSIAQIFIAAQRKHMEDELEAKKKIFEKTSKNRLEIIGMTCESYAERKKNEEYLRMSLHKDQTCSEFAFSEEEYGDLSQVDYQSLLLMYNATMKDFSDDSINKLACLPFFMNLFYLSKNDPFIFYGKYVLQLTMYQCDLFSRGCFYKSILEQGKSPPKAFYEDLEKLVSWYESAAQGQEISSANPSNSNIKTTKQMEGQATGLVGATKDELKQYADQHGGEATDLSAEANALMKKEGKKKLDIFDIAKIHGIDV